MEPAPIPTLQSSDTPPVSRSPSLLVPCSTSPDHRVSLSSSPHIHSPICTLECTVCNSMLHSNRRMTSPSLVQAMYLLRSPSPSWSRSAPISRKNSTIPSSPRNTPESSSSSTPTDTVRENMSQSELLAVVKKCCACEPLGRPDFSTLRHAVTKLNDPRTMSLVLGCFLDRMEEYTNGMESLVEEMTEDYFNEKKKTENLLYELLPKSVCTKLVSGQSVIAETFPSVSVYFGDIVGFTAMWANSPPLEIVEFLNDLYTCFDSIIDNFDVYKVETIGDAYMVASGLPVRNGENHSREIARMALKMVESVKTFPIKDRPDDRLELRIGIHTGPCCAGIVGVKMPRYCLFGDTVNYASRLETFGEPQKIHISSETAEALQSFETFELECRGEIDIKGKGLMKTFWLTGEKAIDMPKKCDMNTFVNNQVNVDEGIDDIDEITFTFHVSDHDSEMLNIVQS